MRALWCGSLVVCLSLGGAIRADDQADAKALVDKAIKAMGGEAKIAKFKAGSWKGKATGQEGGNELVMTNEGTWQGLDKLRMEAEIVIGGRSEKVLVVMNGDKGWAKANDMVKDAPEAELPMIKSAYHAMRMPHLLPGIKEKDYKLTHLGEIKVNDKPAAGVSVAHKDYKDVSLYFDKETSLPARSEVRITEPSGKDVTIEYLYGDYKETDGVKHPMKITVKVDGKEIVLELSEIKAKEKVDDG